LTLSIGLSRGVNSFPPRQRGDGTVFSSHIGFAQNPLRVFSCKLAPVRAWRTPTDRLNWPPNRLQKNEQSFSCTMILLPALLCNYGNGKCLIDIGTEGIYSPDPAPSWWSKSTSKLCDPPGGRVVSAHLPSIVGPLRLARCYELSSEHAFHGNGFT
jgi:hypothetical protein